VVNLITGFMATEEVSLKGSPTVSPDDGGRVQRATFFLSSVSTIFCVVPGAARVGHEHRLVEAKSAIEIR